jgi:MFS family permease
VGGRNAVPFLASDALLTVSYGGMFVALFNLYLGRLGYGTGPIGVANGLTFVSYSLLSIPAGLAAKRWGYRRSMIAGALIYAAFGGESRRPDALRRLHKHAPLLPSCAAGARWR